MQKGLSNTWGHTNRKQRALMQGYLKKRSRQDLAWDPKKQQPTGTDKMIDPTWNPWQMRKEWPERTETLQHSNMGMWGEVSPYQCPQLPYVPLCHPPTQDAQEPCSPSVRQPIVSENLSLRILGKECWDTNGAGQDEQQIDGKH